MQKETLINKKISLSQRFLRDFRFICGLPTLVLWISLAADAVAQAQSRPIVLKLAGAELSISLPSDLEQLTIAMPSVRLFAKVRGPSTYPTLNLIDQPGTLGLNRAKLEAETLTSYRGVGLTDARIVSSSQSSCGGQRCELIEIDYSLKAKNLRGAVVLIDCGLSTAIFTLTGLREQGEALAELRSALISSISVTVQDDLSAPKSEGFNWIFLGIGAVLFLLALTLLLISRKRTRN